MIMQAMIGLLWTGLAATRLCIMSGVPWGQPGPEQADHCLHVSTHVHTDVCAQVYTRVCTHMSIRMSIHRCLVANPGKKKLIIAFRGSEEDKVGHNYIGHNYMGHDYIGRNYVHVDPRKMWSTLMPLGHNYKRP